MANITLSFEPNSLLLYNWEVGEVNKRGSWFTKNRFKIWYDLDSEKYIIRNDGDILYNGKIPTHNFFKQLLKNIEVQS